MFYTFDHIINEIIPASVAVFYKKFRKRYLGDKDDLEQVARLALWEWVSTQPDLNKLPEDFVELIDTALVHEIRRNQRENRTLNYEAILNREPDSDELLFLRNRVRKQLEVLFSRLEYKNDQKDIIYRHFMWGQSVSEIIADINIWRRRVWTREVITTLLKEVRYFLKTKLTKDLVD